MSTKEKTVKFELPNGKKVELFPERANGQALMKIRQVAPHEATVIYLMAEIGTFDGEKLTALEILEFNVFDIIALEAQWMKLSPKK